MSRFFLNLVATTFKTSNASYPTLQLEHIPICFATIKSIVGDVGAPLDFAEGKREEEDEDRDMEDSDDEWDGMGETNVSSWAASDDTKA